VLTIINIVAGALIFAASFWLSIRIIDGPNSANTFGLALLIGAVVAISGGIFGPAFSVIPLVGFAYLMIRYYGIGLIKTVLILVVISIFQELCGRVIRAIILV
jgi:hypothetical protein